MINKVFPSVEEALFDLRDNISVMIGGFGGAGTPHNLIQGLIDKGVMGLTLICNSFNNVMRMQDGRQVKKVIMSFPTTVLRGTMSNPLAAGIESGEIEVEMVPQGTLAERIRAAGAGIRAFYTPTAAGTPLAEGKETAVFDGRPCVLERALHADFALVKAYKADRMGNLIYRKTMQNFNPPMAMAGKVTVVEVEEIVDVGDLDPDHVHTPGIFVQRVVQAPPVVLAFRVPDRPGR